MTEKRCDVDGCGRRHYGRGMCERHYRRWRRTGNVHVEARPSECAVPGCVKVTDANGLCHGHDQRVRRTGELDPQVPLSRRRQPEVCIVSGCGGPTHAHGLCGAHYQRKRTHGGARPEEPVATPTGEGWISHGYRGVTVPPELRHLTNGESKTLEHRLVMALHLGRALEPDEVVHHRNGNRLDNRIENLELWSVYQPKGQRVVDKVTYATTILRRYAPELLAEDPPAADPNGRRPDGPD